MNINFYLFKFLVKSKTFHHKLMFFVTLRYIPLLTLVDFAVDFVWLKFNCICMRFIFVLWYLILTWNHSNKWLFHLFFLNTLPLSVMWFFLLHCYLTEHAFQQRKRYSDSSRSLVDFLWSIHVLLYVHNKIKCCIHKLLEHLFWKIIYLLYNYII